MNITVIIPAIRRTLWGLVAVFPLLFFFSCSHENDMPGASEVEQLPASFSFFDVGVNTAFSKSLRERLGSILGDDAVAGRNTMDLQLNTEDDFLETHFPRLARLNRGLNLPAGERVEHNTTQLTYRYAVKKELPFSYVELLFSRYTGMPLVIRVMFETDTLDILGSLKEKYGPPREVPWKAKNGKTLFWEKNGDFLFYCFVPNQFGIPEYRVSICFTRRIAALFEMEKKIKNTERNTAVSSGNAVF